LATSVTHYYLDRFLVMRHTALGRMQEVCGLLVYAPTNMHVSSP
jgi:hypothetical protein